MIASGKQISIAPESLFGMFRQTAERVPNRVATIFAGKETTYWQLLQHSLHLMGYLETCGISIGDRVGLMMPNCPQYILSYYATTGIGAIVVQVNPLCAAPEFEHVVMDSGMKALIVYEPLLPLVRSVRQEHPMDTVMVVRLGSSNTQLADGEVWLDECIASASPVEPRDFNPEQTVAVLQYTGGTTGQPKGAMLTHYNLVANAVQMLQVQPDIAEEDAVLCALPFFHVYAMTVCMNLFVLRGNRMLIVPRFNPVEVIQLVAAYQPSSFPAVATMYVALAQALPPGSDTLKCIKTCVSGGAPIPVQVMQTFESVSGSTILEGYGLTEASPVTHVNPSRDLRKIGSIGPPLPNTQVRIVSLNDGQTTLPPNEEGELAVRGPQVMLGYWNRPDESQRVLVDGWLLTGDIAKQDEEGYVYIVDRKKDLIIASGYNVYPREVEEVLYKHPAILEAAVIGVPDQYRGETVKAFVVPKSGQQVDTAELDVWCRQNLSAYKVPKSFEIRDELPKTPVGKILRRALKA